MKIAFFNIQNLFFRDRNFIKPPSSKCVQNWTEEMDLLVRKIFKSPRDLERMQELAFLLRIERIDYSKYAVLRSRGAMLYMRNSEYPAMEQSSIGNAWNGWVEVQNYPIDNNAVLNKARLVAETDADVMLLQEVEDRSSVLRFNQQVLKQYPFEGYHNSVLVQGNDFRGQDQALLYRNGYHLDSITPFLEEINSKGELLFEKSCMIYELRTPCNNSIWILSAHLNGGDKDKQTADDKRLEQTKRIAEIYHKMLDMGFENIIVAGTFGTVSYCYSMDPILRGANLKDICRHPTFSPTRDKKRETYYSLGAYSKGINIRQKDYILLSPSLYSKVTSTGMNRKGIWTASKQWSIYHKLTSENHQASEHPVLWASFEF